MPSVHLVLMLAALHAASVPDTLRMTLVVDDTSARATLVHGAVLGAEETNHTGALFGTATALRIASAGDPTQMAAALRDARSASMILLAADSATCAAVGSAPALRTVLILDAGCPAGSLAAASNVYSLVSPLTASARADSTRLELWHWSLDRFGGEQLNQRYQRRFAERMDSRAWSGWFAAKMGLDLALRSHATAGGAMLRQLSTGRQQFDGQKGRPLYFSSDTHRLVQPLYRVAGSGDAEHVVEEVAP